jgi:hypothetical protein
MQHRQRNLDNETKKEENRVIYKEASYCNSFTKIEPYLVSKLLHQIFTNRN